MRALVFAALISAPAYAFDAERTIELLDEANFACFEGQDHDGNPIPEDAIKKACLDTVAYLSQMKENGWCHDRSTGEWSRCT